MVARVILFGLVLFALSGCSNSKSDTLSTTGDTTTPTNQGTTLHVTENYTGAIGKVNTLGSSGNQTLISGEGSEKFTISSDGTLSVTTGLDYETKVQYDLSILVITQTNSNTVARSLSVIVDDYPDVVPVLDIFHASVGENAVAGTKVGEVSIIKSGDSPIQAMELIGEGGENFTIDSKGVILLSSGVKLDFETKNIYNLEAVATNQAGPSQRVQVTIEILDELDEQVLLTITSNYDSNLPLGAYLDSNKDWQPQSVTYSFDFSQSVTGFESSDIDVANGVKSDFSGSGNKYTLVVTPPKLNSTDTITLSVDNNVCIDSQNNGNKQASATQIVDTFVPFITQWKTDNSGTSSSNKVKITTLCATGCNYTVEWGDNTTTHNVEGNITHTYSTIGTYTVKIKGKFDRIIMDNTGEYDPQKLIEIKQWGTIVWSSMERAFKGCERLTLTASDRPNLSNVTSMASMFYEAKVLNSDINSWRVSTVTDMNHTFYNAMNFNGDISDWDVSAVTTMNRMFKFAQKFNGDIAGWETSGVTNMDEMFYNASAFVNHNLSGWNVNSVTSHDLFSFGWGNGSIEPNWKY